MQTYRCTCGNRLFFENTRCVACDAEVGWCEGCQRITTLEPEGDNLYRCSHVDCRRPLRKCHNYAVEDVCNRCFVASDSGQHLSAPASVGPPPISEPDPTPPPAEANVVAAAALCLSCQLN